jgi:hypothetical protein
MFLHHTRVDILATTRPLPRSTTLVELVDNPDMQIEDSMRYAREVCVLQVERSVPPACCNLLLLLSASCLPPSALLLALEEDSMSEHGCVHPFCCHIAVHVELEVACEAAAQGECAKSFMMLPGDLFIGKRRSLCHLIVAFITSLWQQAGQPSDTRVGLSCLQPCPDTGSQHVCPSPLTARVHLNTQLQ